jgi:hypothetical protein
MWRCEDYEETKGQQENAHDDMVEQHGRYEPIGGFGGHTAAEHAIDDGRDAEMKNAQHDQERSPDAQDHRARFS